MPRFEALATSVHGAKEFVGGVEAGGGGVGWGGRLKLILVGLLLLSF